MFAPWFVFVVSAISEYGFDIDFPLTPSLWMAVALCAVVLARVKPAAGSSSCVDGNQLTSVCCSGASVKHPMFPSQDDSRQTYSHDGMAFPLVCGDSSLLSVGHFRFALISEGKLRFAFLDPMTVRGPPGDATYRSHSVLLAECNFSIQQFYTTSLSLIVPSGSTQSTPKEKLA